MTRNTNLCGESPLISTNPPSQILTTTLDYPYTLKIFILLKNMTNVISRQEFELGPKMVSINHLHPPHPISQKRQIININRHPCPILTSNHSDHLHNDIQQHDSITYAYTLLVLSNNHLHSSMLCLILALPRTFFSFCKHSTTAPYCSPSQTVLNHISDMLL